MLTDEQRCKMAVIELQCIAKRHPLINGNISACAKRHGVGVRVLNKYIKDNNIKLEA